MIEQGDPIANSDSSFQDQFGTATWVLEGLCFIGRIIGDVTIPGAAKDQSAYRRELAGIYSLLVCAVHLCDLFDITSGFIELWCDGQSALDKAFNYVSIIRIEVPNYDLLFAICTFWAHSPRT